MTTSQTIILDRARAANDVAEAPIPAEQEVVLQLVRDERAQQEARKADDRWEFTCADDGMPDLEKLAVLGEEFGEVAKALIEQQGASALRAELVQVAAVAVAWAEALREERPAPLRETNTPSGVTRS